MGAGYELRPVTIERSAGRRPIAILLAASLLVGVVVVKPWTLVPTQPLEATVVPPPVTVVQPAPPVPLPRVLATPAVPPAIGSLASHSGSWGVGAAGIGPRYDGESWVDWIALDPWPASVAESVAATGPRAACSDLAAMLDGPLFLALTNPSDVPIDRSVRVWRWDGSTPESLLDDTRIVVPAGDAGISYLVRQDRQPWAPGRYEVQLVAGDRAVALAFCLTPS
jgi:hypothetical protein